MKIKIRDIILIFFICFCLGLTRAILVQDIDIIKSQPSISSTISETLFDNPNFIDIDLCEKLFNEGAIFIDSRDSLNYLQGHIEGSINIPWESYSDDQISNSVKDIIYDQIIIVYCSGGDCTLSIDLADHIFNNLGFEKVLIFEDGYPEWVEKNLPTKRFCVRDESPYDESCIYVE